MDLKCKILLLYLFEYEKYKFEETKRREKEKKNVAREDGPVIKIFTDSQIMAIGGKRWKDGFADTGSCMATVLSGARGTHS